MSLPPLPEGIARELPFQRTTLAIGGYSLHLLLHGEGFPVLFVHGNPTWSFLWRKVLQALSPLPLRCIAPDLIGFGLSDHPRSMALHSLEFHGRIMVELVRRLELKKLVIVGQDWGGPIASWIGVEEPQRVVGAVYLNTALRAPRPPYRTSWFHRLARTPLLSEVLFLGGNFPIPFLPRVQGSPDSLRSVLFAYEYPFRQIRARIAPLALARMVPSHPGHPSLPPLERIEAWARSFKGPVGLVWGKKDPILGRALRGMRELFPHAHVRETEGGHFLQEEYPQEIAEMIALVVKESQSQGGAS